MTRRMAIPQDSARQLARWYDAQLLSKTPVVKGGFFGWFFGLFGQAGVTIDKTIHLTRRAPNDLRSRSGIALIGHEMYHVIQQEQMGWWSFLARYVWHWRPKHIRRGVEHPLERAAYERQKEIERTLSE